LILNVTYFSCLFMSNISPIATSDRRSESLSLNLDQICVCSSVCPSPLQITLGALCIMLLVRRILSNC
jgi:hypothetical protein